MFHSHNKFLVLVHHTVYCLAHLGDIDNSIQVIIKKESSHVSMCTSAEREVIIASMDHEWLHNLKLQYLFNSNCSHIKSVSPSR